MKTPATRTRFARKPSMLPLKMFSHNQDPNRTSAPYHAACISPTQADGWTKRRDNGVVILPACADGEKHSRSGSVQQATAATTTECPWSFHPREIQVVRPVREIIRRSSA